MKKNNNHHSFSARLSLYIILVTSFVFVCSFLFFFFAAKRAVSNESFSHAKSEIKNTSAVIEAGLRQVEQATATTAVLTERLLNTPDIIYRLLEVMVATNPMITGASAAFEPNFYPKHGEHYMLYVHRDGDTIRRKQLGGDTYDYHCMDWYTIPKHLNKNYWSEPYEDKGGGGVVMTTYTHRLTRSDGLMYGVITADVSLKQISQLVESTKPYEQSHPFMLSRNGYYLSHKDKDRILNETIFTDTKEMSDTTAAIIGREMLAGKSGVHLLNNDNTPSYVFYTPIPSTGWSVATVVTQEEIFDELHKMSLMAALIAVFGLLALFGFTVLVIRKVAAPITLFSKSAQMIASGNFDVELPKITSKNELCELRDSFEYMQASLKKYVAELQTATIQQQQVTNELQIARTIQLGMVPKVFPPFPERDDIDLYAVLHPAKEVGGDLYDYFVTNNKLYFTIGDVAGKGIPASLLMAVALSLFRSTVSYITNVEEIVTHINHSLSETNEINMFITLFVGVLDLKSGRLDYCNAGHNPPAIISEGIKAEFMTTVVNIPIGVFDDYAFKSSFCELKQGDTIFLYTDGVTEAKNLHNKLYGEQALLDELRITAICAPKEIVDAVVDSVATFTEGEESHDDVTLLAIKYGAPEIRYSLDKERPYINTLATVVKTLNERWNIPQSETMSLRLATEEALENVIAYAYPIGTKGKIDLMMRKNTGWITIEISDRGIAFDPTQIAAVDISASVEERLIGGLGIFLLRSLMDEVTYRRDGEYNRLTLKKRIDESDNYK